MDSSCLFKLADEPGSLGLRCDQSGLSLAGVPLLRRTSTGFAARPRLQIERLLNRAYGRDIDVGPIMARLEDIATALNAGELARAMIAAVLLKLPALDWDGATDCLCR